MGKQYNIVYGTMGAFLAALLGQPAFAKTVTAASCSQTNVTTAISSAVPGDTVQVPAGSCAWTGFSYSGIQLVGSGSGTNGTVITAGTVNLNKHASQHTRLSGFRFTGSGTHITVSGAASAKAYVIDNNYFFTTGQKLGYIYANGGLFHHNEFYFPPGNNGETVFIISTSEDWSQDPTFGVDDTSGERNIYFEDNKWTNFVEVSMDGDSGSRLVIRRNQFIDSSFTFHGGSPADSSPRGGVRQFEIYENTFTRINNLLPVNKWVWVRGGTGVIANNKMDRADSPDGFSYGGKPELRISLACTQQPGYPVQYQLGQSNVNPESIPSHPLAIYGNTGAGPLDSNFIAPGSSDTAGGSCADYQNYIKLGRDYVLSQTWPYQPYPYPHQLQALGGGPLPPPSSGKIIRSTPTTLRINN